MVTIAKSSNVYTVKFPYDPDTISKIKGVPGRRWRPDLKAWTVPLASREDMRQVFPDDAPTRPKAAITVDYGGYEPQTQPFGYQQVGASFLSQTGGALFDEQGTGKTRQALDAFGILRSKGEVARMLVI